MKYFGLEVHNWYQSTRYFPCVVLKDARIYRSDRFLAPTNGLGIMNERTDPGFVISQKLGTQSPTFYMPRFV